MNVVSDLSAYKKTPDIVAAVDALPPLRDVIAAHELRAEKKLGQNFILDLNITDKIARAAGDLNGIVAIEIGPGPGGLTRALVRSDADRVLAVEYDTRAIAALQGLRDAAGPRLDLVHADALKLNLLDLVPGSRRAIIANLPYNIATPLLIGWLKQWHANPQAYDSITIMVQREVAERMSAAPGTDHYGRLSVLVGWLCKATMMFDLPPSAFVPPPKVTSTVVHLTRHPVTDGASAQIPSFKTVERVTAAAFGQRRKMLRQSLKTFPGLLESCGIDGTKRAEQLPVSDFLAMAAHLDQTGQ